MTDDAVASASCPPDAAADAFVSRLKQGCKLLVAVSGGSDSVGLLVALDHARSRSNRHDIVISAATVDHQLRPEGALEAQQVARLCQSLGMSHRTLVWEDEKPSSAVMEHARNARYRLLVDHAAAIGADCMAVAHTRNDQAETLSMRRAHARDDAGHLLAGMAEHTLLGGRLWLCRPFLDVSRQAIRTMLDALHIGWADDPSNDDDHYERVRQRKAIARAGRVDGLAAEAFAAGIERSAVSKDAALLFEKAVIVHAQAAVTVDVGLLGDDAPHRRYLLNALILVVGGRPYGPGQDALDLIAALLADERSTRINVGRCLVEKRGQRLFIMRETRDLPDVHLAAGRKVLWDNRFVIENRSGADIDIMAGLSADSACGQLLSSLPPRTKNAVLASLPHCAPQGDPGRVVMKPFLAPFDVFLSAFDFALANVIAVAFTLPVYPPLSSVYSDSESKS